MLKKQKIVKRYICLYLNFTDEYIKELLSKTKSKEITDATEVVINYNGKEKKMTFKSFFKKLGY